MGRDWPWCVGCSLSVPFWIRGLGWGWVLPFCGSCAHFRLAVASQSQSCWAVGRWGCGVSVLLFCLFRILRAVGAWRGTLLSFGFLLRQPKSKRVFFCLSKSVVQNNSK